MILALSLKQSYIGLGSKRDIRKTKQRSSIVVNLGLRWLDYQKTIFTGLELLHFSSKKFRRSWIVKSGF